MAASKTTAKPPAPLLPDEAAADVEAARAALAAVHAAIAAGASTDPAQLAQAEDRLHLAQLRIDLAAKNAADAAEARRLRRLAEVADDLTGPAHRERLRRLVGAYAAAEAAVRTLWEEATDRQDRLRAGLAEVSRLARLGPLPAGVEVELDSDRCNAVVVDGRRSPPLAYWSDEPAACVADVAALVLVPDAGRCAIASEQMALVNYLPGNRLAALKAAIDDLHDLDDDHDDHADGR